MEHNGFITIPRSIATWASWAEATPAHRAVLLELARTAAWKARRERGQWLKPGQCLTSLNTLARACNCSRKAVRRALDAWEGHNIISKRSAAGRTLVTILCWHRFQGAPRTQGRTQGGHTPKNGTRTQGRTQGGGSVREGEPEGYDEPTRGADTGADTPPENAESRGADTGADTPRRVRDREEVCKEENKTPFGTFPPFSEPSALAERLGVGIPASLREWVQSRNGSLPEETIQDFLGDVRRRVESDGAEAVAPALKELADDPPDQPRALARYWQRIADRHRRSHRKEQRREQEWAENRQKREDDGGTGTPPDIDFAAIRRTLGMGRDKNSAPADGDKQRVGESGENVRDDSDDDKGDRTGAGDGTGGKQKTLDGGTQNEDGSVTHEVKKNEEPPF